MANPIIELDESLFVSINQDWSSNSMDTFMVILSNPYTWIPVYLLFILLIIKLKKKRAAIYLVGLVMTFALSDSISSRVFKPLFKRTRPCNEAHLHARVPYKKSHSFGFVSSHAANHAALATFMFLLLGRIIRLRWSLWIWVLMVSYSRVYLGVHFPGDVLCGMLLGLIIGWLVFRLSVMCDEKWGLRLDRIHFL